MAVRPATAVDQVVAYMRDSQAAADVTESLQSLCEDVLGGHVASSVIPEVRGLGTLLYLTSCALSMRAGEGPRRSNSSSAILGTTLGEESARVTRAVELRLPSSSAHVHTGLGMRRVSLLASPGVGRLLTSAGMSATAEYALAITEARMNGSPEPPASLRAHRSGMQSLTGRVGLRSGSASIPPPPPHALHRHADTQLDKTIFAVSDALASAKLRAATSLLYILRLLRTFSNSAASSIAKHITSLLGVVAPRLPAALRTSLLNLLVTTTLLFALSTRAALPAGGITHTLSKFIDDAVAGYYLTRGGSPIALKDWVLGMRPIRPLALTPEDEGWARSAKVAGHLLLAKTAVQCVSYVVKIAMGVRQERRRVEAEAAAAAAGLRVGEGEGEGEDDHAQGEVEEVEETRPSCARGDPRIPHVPADVYSSSIPPPAARTCPLCLSPRVFPTVTPCGHIFCWACAVKGVKDSCKCPICRDDCEARELVCLRGYA